MIDVHSPHEPVQGWRDILLHLLIITIGLFIALSLEGLVEWHHHRSLVHEAELSLHGEIVGNAKGVDRLAADIRKQQDTLRHDDLVLDEIIRTGKPPAHDQMSIEFHLTGFDDVSWKTAQQTGALAYMKYSAAQEYSSIYSTQDEVSAAAHVAVRDAILSLAPFMDPKQDKGAPNAATAAVVHDHIDVLQGQLLLLQSFVQGLDGEYKNFLKAHP